MIKKGKKEEESRETRARRSKAPCSWWPVWETRARSTQLTPHNLGFLAVDRLAEQHGIRVTRRDSKALVGVGEIDGREVMLAKPQTFMNLSGTSLAPLMEKHGIELGPLVVVYDELDLPWRALRIKPKGSAAGHNGMKIGDPEFENQRVRAGTVRDSSGPSDSGWTRNLCWRRSSARK